MTKRLWRTKLHRKDIQDASRPPFCPGERHARIFSIEFALCSPRAFFDLAKIGAVQGLRHACNRRGRFSRVFPDTADDQPALKRHLPSSRRVKTPVKCAASIFACAGVPAHAIDDVGTHLGPGGRTREFEFEPLPCLRGSSNALQVNNCATKARDHNGGQYPSAQRNGSCCYSRCVFVPFAYGKRYDVLNANGTDSAHHFLNSRDCLSEPCKHVAMSCASWRADRLRGVRVGPDRRNSIG